MFELMGWKDDDELTITFGTLRAGLLEARVAERERIIALLESLKGTCNGNCDDCRTHAEAGDIYLTNLVALIKGETE